MFDELTKYKDKDHFFFKPEDSLGNVCNAPNSKSGVYIVYELKNDKVDLIYIGSSGKKLSDGSIKTRKAGLGGLKDRLVNGHHFGKIPRKKSWVHQMYKERIEALDVYWYVTYNDKIQDCPVCIERIIQRRYIDIYGTLPRWNKELAKNCKH